MGNYGCGTGTGPLLLLFGNQGCNESQIDKCEIERAAYKQKFGSEVLTIIFTGTWGHSHIIKCYESATFGISTSNEFHLQGIYKCCTNV